MGVNNDKLVTADVLIVSMGAYANDDVHVNKPSTRRLLQTSRALAEELRELHDRTGISLDNWTTAREFVEAFTGPITENHA